MAVIGNATSLMALDALVVDTETTGLDPAKAWIVEFAAVRLTNGKVDSEPSLHMRVKPGVAIPAAATEIHGIDDVAVADAPAFAAVAPEIADAFEDAVVIGHAIGFDLAVLKREFNRAKSKWRAPRTLDTRLLAEIVAPGLAGYSLESLSAWLGVTMGMRHSALGDAETTARVFMALVPKLRDVGIRTLAEAERACLAKTATLESQHRAGWAEPVQALAEAPSAARIDSYPYRHRVAGVMTAPAHFVTPRATLGEVLECMMRERVSSVFVHPDGTNRPARPDEVGIVTERDVLRAIANSGVSVLAMPAAEFASRPLAAISAEAFCYLAIARMRRLDVRHLGVTDSAGFVEGALSARDLLRLRAEGAISLGDEIEEAAGVPDLARAWSKLPQVAAALLADGASGRQIAAVISDQICALTAQAAVFAERRMRENGHGSAPCPYAVAVLGSAGRGESLLALDQDNALVFAEGAEGGPEDIWFGRLGGQIADILHEAGVPYCKGGVMAKNADWRGSVATWRRRIEHWVGRSDPEDLLAVDIFFDMLGVHGDFMLADGVWSAAFDAAKGQAVFAKLLADTAGEVAPGLTMFGRIRTEQGRIDLKRAGLFGIVSTARSLAVCHHVVERSTPARLSGVSALGLGGSDLEALQEAQVVFLDLIVAQQIKDIERGITLSNAIEVRALHRRDRERLLAALGAVRHLSDLTRDLLFRS